MKPLLHASPRRQAGSSPQLRTSDRIVILMMFLLPVPLFLGEAAARTADAFRFGSVSGRVLLSQLAWGEHVRRISAILFLMFAFAGLSMICGMSHSIRDLLDVLRIVGFWTVFLFGASLAWRGRAAPTMAAISCLNLLLVIGMLNALFTISQYLFPEVTRPAQEWFATGDRHISLLPQQGRAFGFFVSPNTNAVMLLLLSLPGMALFQLTRRPRYLFLGLFVFGSVLLTSSRTGFLIAIVLVGVLCVASRKVEYLLALIILSWLSYIGLDYLVNSGMFAQWFPYLSVLLNQIHGALHGGSFDAQSINSFNSRLAIWDEALQWFYSNPLVGAGPLREVTSSVTDNYYVYALSRYGLIGFALYVSFAVYLAGLSILASMSSHRPAKELGLVLLAIVVTVNVANYTMEAFLAVPVAMVTLLMAGYLAGMLDAQQASTRRAQARTWNGSKSKA